MKIRSVANTADGADSVRQGRYLWAMISLWVTHTIACLAWLLQLDVMPLDGLTWSSVVFVNLLLGMSAWSALNSPPPARVRSLHLVFIAILVATLMLPHQDAVGLCVLWLSFMIVASLCLPRSFAYGVGAVSALGLSVIPLSVFLEAQAGSCHLDSTLAPTHPMMTGPDCLILSGVFFSYALLRGGGSREMHNVLAQTIGTTDGMSSTALSRPALNHGETTERFGGDNKTVRIRNRIAWVIMGDLVCAGVFTKALAEYDYVVRLTHNKDDVERDFRSALRVDLLVLDTNDHQLLAQDITHQIRRRLPNLSIIYVSSVDSPKWARALDTDDACLVSLSKPLVESRIKKTVSVFAAQAEIRAKPKSSKTRFS